MLVGSEVCGWAERFASQEHVISAQDAVMRVGSVKAHLEILCCLQLALVPLGLCRQEWFIEDWKSVARMSPQQ